MVQFSLTFNMCTVRLSNLPLQVPNLYNKHKVSLDQNESVIFRVSNPALSGGQIVAPVCQSGRFLNMESYGETTWINHWDQPLKPPASLSQCMCVCVCGFLPPTSKHPLLSVSAPSLA